MRKRKSISHWWSILADHYVWLWGNNLLYLLCIAPGVICGFLFLSFHAYVFLAFAAGLFVIAGPAILAIQEVAMCAALERPKTTRIRFFASCRRNGKKGLTLGLVLAVLCIAAALPTYFALSISSPVLPIIVFSCCTALLLWYSCSSQLLRQISAGDKISWEALGNDVFSNGIRSVLFGAAKLIWVIFCLLAPTAALPCAVAGVPVLLRFTILYVLYSEGDADA